VVVDRIAFEDVAVELVRDAGGVVGFIDRAIGSDRIAFAAHDHAGHVRRMPACEHAALLSRFGRTAGSRHAADQRIERTARAQPLGDEERALRALTHAIAAMDAQRFEHVGRDDTTATVAWHRRCIPLDGCGGRSMRDVNGGIGTRDGSGRPASGRDLRCRGRTAPLGRLEGTTKAANLRQDGGGRGPRAPWQGRPDIVEAHVLGTER